MSRSSKVRKFSCCVLDFRYIFLIFISRQNKLVCTQRAPRKITRFIPFRVTFWRYASFVAGIHCRGEDLAFFLPCHIFPMRKNYFVARMQCVSVDFTSSDFVQHATCERRVLDFIALFAFTSVGECKVKEPSKHSHLLKSSLA